MTWEDVEYAVQRAIVRASGYATEQVVWAFQDMDEPTLDHISLSLGGEMAVGIDRLHISENLSRPNGQEIRQEVQGTREVPLTVEVFTSSVIGELAARRVAELIRARLRLPDVRSIFRRAGVSPFDPGPVDWIPDIPNASFRGRARMIIRCYVPVMGADEYVGYIARVRGTIFPRGYVGPSGASGIAFDSADSS